MLAASLWAFDAVIRTVLSGKIPAASIVLIEHIIGFIFLIPLFIKGIKSYKKLNIKDWFWVFLMTLFNSVLGTTLFTLALAKSFAVYDFVTPLLLQKLQPVIVIILSAIFLKEKLSWKFLLMIPIVLIGSYMVGFSADPVSFSIQGKEEVALLALGAAFFWGSGIILNKIVLKKLTFTESISIRFLLAIPISFIFTLILGQTFPLSGLDGSDILRFVLIAFTTGAAALLLYYKGLQTTEAKVSTIAELMFPVLSVIIAITTLNPYGAPQELTLGNVFGILVLVISILIISLEYNGGNQKDKR